VYWLALGVLDSRLLREVKNPRTRPRQSLQRFSDSSQQRAWAAQVPRKDLERDAAKANAANKGVVDLGPHLATFAKRGGKLILGTL